MSGVGSHTLPNNGRHELWLTPPEILWALGVFDLDPCACPAPRPWPTAQKHIAFPDNGLDAPWEGRVWLNPPYGEFTCEWMKRMAEHGNGTALIFARTETETWIRWVWPSAKAVLFLAGRLYFHLPDGTRAKGNAGGPSALIAYSDRDARQLWDSGISGTLVNVGKVTP